MEDHLKSREVGEPNKEEYDSMQEAVEKEVMYNIHHSELEQFVSDEDKYNHYLQNKSKWEQHLTSEQYDDLLKQKRQQADKYWKNFKDINRHERFKITDE